MRTAIAKFHTDYTVASLPVSSPSTGEDYDGGVITYQALIPRQDLLKLLPDPAMLLGVLDNL
jgi:hypothetical protein